VDLSFDTRAYPSIVHAEHSMPDVRFDTFGLNARLLKRPKPMGRIHHHHEVEMNYVFRGGITYLHRGTVRRLESRRLAVFWGSTPHSLVAVDPGTEMAWITIPLAWIWSWRLPERFVRDLMEGGWRFAPESFGERFQLRAWVDELYNPTRAQQRRLLLELEACFLWLADQSADTARTPVAHWGKDESTVGLQRVEKMARFMAERFHEELSVADIAGAAKLHPNYAMPLFRKHCGVTIRDYLLQYRITHAQRLLLTTDDKIIDVALASGFSSQSSFYSVFERLVNDTPQAFRRRMES
jgi:AraC family transcriptional regulator, melibiose operon regulatory protein